MTDAPAPAAAAPAHPSRRRALSVLAVVGVLLAVGTAADLFAAAEPAAPPEPVEQGAAAAGSWYCPVVAGEGETATLTVAAVAEQPSAVVVERFGSGRAVADDVRTVQPGTATVVELQGADAAAPTTVRWTGGATVATWRVNGDRTAAATCEPGPAQRWHVVGFDTNLGLTSTLHLFNPFTADAVVRLVFATPKGPEELVLADNILVGAGATTSLNLRRFQPEVSDLGVIVEVLSGRVVAQGEQIIVPPPRTSGSSGRLLLSATPQTSESWYFAYAAHGEDNESWLSVLNPGEDVAAVEVRVSNPRTGASNLLGEVSVPGGGTARVELAGASKDAGFGVAVNVVNGQPVVVARSTSLTAGGRSGVSGGLGSPGLSTRWGLVAGDARNANAAVSLYNPGGQTATVTVSARGAPTESEAIELLPNVRTYVQVGDAGGDGRPVPVVVSADLPIVADVRTIADEGQELGLAIIGGVREAVWLGPPTRPPVRRSSSLSTSAGQAPPSEADLPDDLDDLEDLPGQPAPGPS